MADPEVLEVGEVIALDFRRVRVVGNQDGTICRDVRGRIAVRNEATNRLSYIPEWRLINAAQQTWTCPRCENDTTASDMIDGRCGECRLHEDEAGWTDEAEGPLN